MVEPQKATVTGLPFKDKLHLTTETKASESKLSPRRDPTLFIIGSRG